jgi:hypothetical protein
MFSLVVMDPVRCVGQTFDAVEVGNIVVVGLSKIRAEVLIVLARATPPLVVDLI